ncbi:MAG: hypothetical protein ABIM89_00245 [Mycobacteriales bacterium]
MTTDDGGPGARPGVRANALSATTFTRLRIIDSRVSDALLDVLEDAGVAAFVEPSAGDVGPYREVRAHRTPSDQLYVDAASRGAADLVIDAELPGMLAELELQPEEQDDMFAAIVAGFDESADADHVPDIERSSAPATATTDGDEEWYAAAAPARDPDGEEHFVPPPPPPLPRLSGRKMWGVLGLVGGVLLMVLLPLLLDVESDDAVVVGVVVMAAGAATLVSQMRDARDDSDPDDGAVV